MVPTTSRWLRQVLGVRFQVSGPRFLALAAMALLLSPAAYSAVGAQRPAVPAAAPQAAGAAPQAARPTPPPPIISPEVNRNDGRITFRLRAPNAKEVRVTGDFEGSPLAMTRDDSGVWSVTSAPFMPAIYSYTFSVDGVAMTDPGNPLLKSGTRSAASVLNFPGTQPGVWDERPVAHGVLHTHTYLSKSLEETRRFIVYTPPGYEKDAQARFPVLYLLHGLSDDETAWTSFGKAHLIFDNLLADKKMQPMVVVMPFGQTLPLSTMRGTSWLGDNLQRFERDLVGDVMPEAENRYRVHRDARYRALAGLSMGGGQALEIGLRHLDLFGWVAGFSSAIFKDSIDKTFGPLVASPAVNQKLRFLWVTCGKDDRLLPGSTALVSLLETNKVSRYESVVTSGAHTWHVWRSHLSDIAPKLFMEKK